MRDQTGSWGSNLLTECCCRDTRTAMPQSTTVSHTADSPSNLRTMNLHSSIAPSYTEARLFSGCSHRAERRRPARARI